MIPGILPATVEEIAAQIPRWEQEIGDRAAMLKALQCVIQLCRDTIQENNTLKLKVKTAPLEKGYQWIDPPGHWVR